MRMLIGDGYADASDGRILEVLNPAGLETVDSVPRATRQDVEAAVKYAREGFHEWSSLPLCERVAVIERFRELLRENAHELTGLMQAESGKLTEFARAEVDGAADNLTTYIQYAVTMHGECPAPSNRKSSCGHLIATVREPVGVVAAIAPFNYPVGTLGHKIVPALLMGNAVIAKPSSETPLCGLRYCELLREAGVPPKAIQAITGRGGEMGDWLTDNPGIDAVTLTGSTAVGRAIARNSADHLHILSMELGGNDPLVILEDADISLAVRESIDGRLPNAGQTCCAAKRFIVDNRIRAEYERRLIEALSHKKIGDPRDEKSDLGPLVSLKAAKEVEEQLNTAVSQGGEILLGGKRINDTYIEPTVIRLPRTADAARNTEIFGPVWSVIGFDSDDEAADIANDTVYGLSSGIIGRDMERVMHTARALRAGGCIINGAGNYGSPDQPFGGFKQSGSGREGGRYSFEEVSRLKSYVFKNLF